MPRLPPPAVTFALVVLLAGAGLGAGLGGYPLWEPDEARHAEIGREMLAAPGWDGWVVPSLNGEPYRNKPAPFYWLMAAAFALLGVNEWAARLVPAASALATIVVVALWAARRWGLRTGALAGVVLATAVEFVVLGRLATPDMTLTLWVTLGVLAVYRFTERPGASLVPAALAAGLGLLTKGLVAPVLVGAVGLAYLASRRRLRQLTPGVLARAALAFVLLVLPWHVAAGLLDPPYLQRLYVDQQWRRAVDPVSRLHPRPFLFYVPVLLGGFFPWSALLPASVRATLWPGRRGDEETLCGLWAGLVVLLFSLSEGKVGSYIAPAFPPLALLTARHLDRLLAGEAAALEVSLSRAGLWVATVVLALAPAAAITAGALTYGGALAATSLWSLLLLPPAAGLALLLDRGRLRAAVLVLAGTTAAGLLALYGLAAPALGDVHSDAPLARALLAAAPDHAAAPLVAYHVRSASMSFYLARPVLLRERPHQLERLLAQHPLVFVVTSPRHVPELLSAAPFVPWHIGPRRVLYASQPPPGEPPGNP